MALGKSGRPLFDRGASEHQGACAVEKLFPLKMKNLKWIAKDMWSKAK